MSSADQQSAYTYAQTLCSNAGVTLPSLSQLTAQASSASATASGSKATGTKSTSSTTGAVQSMSEAGHTLTNMGAILFCMGLGFLWV
jgi:hypothetical protein